MKRVARYILVCLLCSSFPLHAQKLRPVAIDSLGFGNFAIDTLYIAKDSSAMRGFYQKLDDVLTTKQGRLSILHIGGSHVQAGTMSNRIRQNILANCPDLVSGRGIIFPYSVAPKCNNPGDYKVRKNVTFGLVRNVYQTHNKPLGINGIAVYTSDSSAYITIRLADTLVSYTTTHITLLGQPDNDSAEIIPTIVVKGKEYEPYEYTSALGQYRYNVPTFTDTFALKLNCRQHTDFSIRGLILDNEKPGITFHSIGVNGASTDSYLRCVWFSDELPLITPDLVIFGIGINDAAGAKFDTVAFRKNYLAIVNRFREANPDCAFIFLTNNDSYRGSGKKAAPNRNGLLAREVFYRLADEVGGAVWDQFDIMGGLGSVQKWKNAGYAQGDRVHFTANGYNLVGDLFYNAFVETMGKLKVEN